MPFLDALVYGYREIKDAIGNIAPKRSTLRVATWTDDPINDETVIETGGGGSATGSNLGAGAEVFKDATSGNLRHRTLTTTGTLLASQTEGTDEVNLRPLPPGHVNIVDYGALPSNSDGSGTQTDCTAAFLAAIAAASSVDSSLNGQGVVYVPPAGEGKDWYIAGTANAAFRYPHLEISRSVVIQGVGTGRGSQNGSRIRFPQGCAGFRFVPASGSSDGGDATGAAIRGLAIYGVNIDDAASTITRGWTAGATRLVGDRIRPHRFHGLFYECVKAGTSRGGLQSFTDCAQDNLDTYANHAGRIGPRWVANHAYPSGSIVIPSNDALTNTRLAWVSSGGTSAGSEPTWTDGLGDTVTDGTITWTSARGNRWRPAATVLVGQKIYTNTACGQTFTCTVAGMTGGSRWDTMTDESLNETGHVAGRQENVGESAWTQNALDPLTSIIDSIVEVDGPTWACDRTTYTITSASNATPIVITTSGAHGRSNGDYISIRGVTGNAAANVEGYVSAKTSNTFELLDRFQNPSVGVGSGTGGTLSTVTDPEPLWEIEAQGVCYAAPWTAATAYAYGAQTFATGRWDVIFVANFSGAGPKTSGGSEPAAFATAMPGDAGITDGLITWHPISPVGVVADGTAVWISRHAGAVLVNTQCEIDNFSFFDFAGSAIGIYSYVGPGLFWAADFIKVRNGTLIGNGIGIYPRGGDANACTFEDILIIADAADYWLDPADHAIYDQSFLGNHYERIIIQGASGYAMAMMGAAASGTIKSSYIEGQGRKSPINGNTQVLGGTISIDLFRADSVDQNAGCSGGAFFMGADGVVNMTAKSRYYPFTITAAMKKSRQGVHYFNALNDVSPGTGDDTAGFEMQYGIYYGWWTLLHVGGIPTYSLSGTNGDLGPGHFAFYNGYLSGGALRHYHFGDDQTARGQIVNVGVRVRGDYIDRPDIAAVGRAYFYVNVNTNASSYGLDWAATTGYNPSAVISPVDAPAGLAFNAGAGGTSGSSRPTWPTSLGGTVVDGSVTWTAVQGADFRPAGMIESGTVRNVDVSGGDVTITMADDNVRVTAVGGGSVKLPATGHFEGKWFSIKSGGAFKAVVDGNGKNIDGSATYTQIINRECTLMRFNEDADEWECR